jgi:hypothetical protein
MTARRSEGILARKRHEYGLIQKRRSARTLPWKWHEYGGNKNDGLWDPHILQKPCIKQRLCFPRQIRDIFPATRRFFPRQIPARSVACFPPPVVFVSRQIPARSVPRFTPPIVSPSRQIRANFPATSAPRSQLERQKLPSPAGAPESLQSSHPLYTCQLERQNPSSRPTPYIPTSWSSRIPPAVAFSIYPPAGAPESLQSSHPLSTRQLELQNPVSRLPHMSYI